MYLETARLLMRDYERKDQEAYFQLKSHPKTMYYLQDIQVFTHQESEEDFNRVLEDMEKEDRTFYFFHLELKDTHEQVGSVGYTVTDRTPMGKMVHAGYFIYPQFWNKGYTTEAFRKVLEFAFLKDHVYQVATGCLSENVGSERVMIKCGMIKEAEHVDYEWHDGRMKTRVEYRLLKREWEERRLPE